MDQLRSHCSDCGQGLTRREFVRSTGAAALAAGAAGWLATARSALGRPTPQCAAESAVKRLYDSLSENQRRVVCFPFQHELRQRISANWAITEPRIGNEFYSNEQRELIREILRGVTSEDGYERFLRQMEDDWGGFGEYTMAIFGEPGTGQFEWELTGRHLTLRADGDSVANTAFGGPVIYGHGEESSPSANLFHYQTKKVNEVFAALNGKQRERALLASAPPESDVPIQGAAGKFPGLPVAELSKDQRELFESVMKTILAPYRTEDVDEVLAILKASGGLEQLHLAFYREGDLQDDGVWDIWRVEGPALVWHFRGAPHVHAYVNIGLATS